MHDKTVLPLLRQDVILDRRYVDGLDGAATRYLLVDNITRFKLRMNEIEGIVADTLQQLPAGATYEQVRKTIKNVFWKDIDDATITHVVERLDALALTDRKLPRDEIIQKQKAERRRLHEATQVPALAAAVARVREEVPYYKTLLSQPQYKDVRIESMADIQKLPLLHKSALRESFHLLQPQRFADDPSTWTVEWRSSSGSTGVRTQCVQVGGFIRYSYWEALGPNASLDTPRSAAHLTAPVCTGAECHMDLDMPRTARERFGRLYMRSPSNVTTMTEKQIKAVLDEMLEMKPEELTGGASYWYPIAKYIKKHRIQVPFVRKIYLALETASQIHRRMLAETFNCPVEGVYILSECGYIAFACSGGVHHVAPSYKVELLAGERPAKPGELGKITVSTLGFQNGLTPLLRYVGGDVGMVPEGDCGCPLSHRDGFVFHGRAIEIIQATDGRLLTPRLVDNVVGHESVSEGIDYYSLVQLGSKNYRLLYTSETGLAREPQLMAKLKELLGADANVSIDRRPELSPTNPGGRYRLCYQEQSKNWLAEL